MVVLSTSDYRFFPQRETILLDCMATSHPNAGLWAGTRDMCEEIEDGWMDALWPVSPTFSRHFLEGAKNPMWLWHSFLGVIATLAAEPTGAQKCLWLDPDHPHWVQLAINHWKQNEHECQETGRARSSPTLPCWLMPLMVVGKGTSPCLPAWECHKLPHA